MRTTAETLHRAAAIGAAGLLAMTLATAPAGAQGRGSNIEFGVQAGATIPTGDYANVAGTGWNAGVLLGIRSPGSAVGFRIDATYHGLGSKDLSTFTYKPSVISATGNIVFPLGTAPGATARPYLLGGVGVYGLRSTCDGCETTTDTKFGINGGGGIEFPLSGFTAFVEGRFHHVFVSSGDNTLGIGSVSANFIPLSFGLLFR